MSPGSRGFLVGRHVQLDQVPTPFLACHAVAGAHGQPMQPGIPRSRVTDGTHVPPGRDERFLDRVLGAVPIAQDEGGDGIQPADRRSRQDGERVVVAQDRPFHELSLHATTGLVRRIRPHSYLMGTHQSETVPSTLRVVGRPGSHDREDADAARYLTPQMAAATASAKMRRAVSISSPVTISGGDSRTHDPPAWSTSRPRSKQPHSTRSARSGVSSSMPIIRPLPRMSVMMPGNRAGQGRGPAWRVPLDRGVVDQAILQQVDGGERGGTRHGVAAIGRSVRARPPGLQQLCPGDHARDGHPRPDALGRQQDVRLDALVLDGPHPARSAGARLDLVRDEHDAVSSQMRRSPARKPGSGTM